jgi:hypothetical protein
MYYVILNILLILDGEKNSKICKEVLQVVKNITRRWREF